MSEAANEFARWAIRHACFDDRSLDGGDVQQKAYELGLLIREDFDPDKHDGHGAEFCESGDDWFTLAPALRKKKPLRCITMGVLSGLATVPFTFSMWVGIEVIEQPALQFFNGYVSGMILNYIYSKLVHDA